MRKILLSAACLLPMMSLASTKQTASPFPYAKNGINIMPLADMKLPDEMNKQMLVTTKTTATTGYIDTTQTDQDVISLFALQKDSQNELRQFDADNNPLDTHLKSSLSKLELSFNFTEIPGIEKNNVIGFAVTGGYVKEKGWDGVVEFALIPTLGVCSFTTYKIESVILDKESLEYLVNKKPSNKNIAGNRNTGFLYTLNWYNPDRLMTFQCANKMLNPKNMSQMIDIANQIDPQIK